MNKAALLTFACMVLPACAGMGLEEPKSVGEINTGYNYVPVDPLEVDVVPGTPIPAGASALQMRKLRYSRCVGRRDNGDPDKVDVMDALPDHTVRMAVRRAGPAVGDLVQSLSVSVGNAIRLSSTRYLPIRPTCPWRSRSEMVGQARNSCPCLKIFPSKLTSRSYD